jgi:hypothetical protein
MTMIKIILLINIFNIILKSSSFKYNIKQIIIIILYTYIFKNNIITWKT